MRGCPRFAGRWLTWGSFLSFNACVLLGSVILSIAKDLLFLPFRAGIYTVCMYDSIAKQFLDTSAKQLEVHSSRIDDCLGRLTHDQLWWRGADAQNSVANLVLHLCGNVGQSTAAFVDLPDTRDREREFEQRSGLTSNELRAMLKATVSAAVAAFRSMPDDRLKEIVRTKLYERPI